MVEKRTYVQRDFSMGVAIPELLEGDDLDMRAQSLKGGQNMRVTSGRTLRQRPGLAFKAVSSADARYFRMRPEVDLQFSVVIRDGSLEVMDAEYAVVHTESTVPWDSAASVWVAEFGEALVIGPEFYALEYDAEDDTWAFGPLLFAEQPGGNRSLPFWSYAPGVTIQPSGYTGTVVVTASEPIFGPFWVGDTIRYAGAHLVITEFISLTKLRAEIQLELPPTFEFGMASADKLSGFAEGQIITASDTNWSGIIIDITGTTITAVTVQSDAPTISSTGEGADYGGPTTSENINSANASSTPTSVTKATAPGATVVWDEQLWSARRGYPLSGAAVNNRLALCDFPQIPDLIAMSSSRAFNDFKTGLNDDDAIVRQAGNDTPRFRHVVSAVDLIILSDKGCYYVKTRDGELVTPSNFQVVEFDQRGSASAKPVLIEGGVLFVEQGQDAVGVCVLSGNVYLNWTVLDLTRFSAQIFDAPTALCGPVASSDMRENYALVRNSDGTLAAMSWFANFGEERAGFIPWITDGEFLDVFPLFDGYHVKVKRGSAYTLERFDSTFFLDGAVRGTGFVTDGTPLLHLANRTDVLRWSDYTSSTITVDAAGNLVDPPSSAAETQWGVYFQAEAEPWPREVLESPRLGMLKSRVIRFSVGVRDTVSFAALRNATTSYGRPYTLQGGQTPVPGRDVFRFNIFGNKAHPEIKVHSFEPNPLEITSITQEVQA